MKKRNRTLRVNRLYRWQNPTISEDVGIVILGRKSDSCMNSHRYLCLCLWDKKSGSTWDVGELTWTYLANGWKELRARR